MTIFRLEEKDLPFKVKRKDKPKIVHKRVEPESGVIGVYHPDSHTVEMYKGATPMDTQHEIAHYQLHDFRRTGEESLDELAEEEIQADLLAFSRTIIEPEDYKQRLMGIIDFMKKQLEHWDADDFAKARRVAQVVTKAMLKYWRWLPPEWKDAYYEMRKQYRAYKTRISTARQKQVKRKRGEKQEKLTPKISTVR